MFCSKMFVLIVLLAGIFKSKANEEYCDPSLCSEGITHIACDHYLVSDNNTKVRNSFNLLLNSLRNLLKNVVKIQKL